MRRTKVPLNCRTILTIWGDEISGFERERLAKEIASKIKKGWPNLRRVSPVHRTVAELEFWLYCPNDHAFGIYSGYEIVLNGNVDAWELKEIAIEVERKEKVDVDVFVLDLSTRKLVKFSHSGESKPLKPRMPIKELSRYQ